MQNKGSFIFFIGGSGARVCKAFLHACASGAVSDEIVHIMLLDADSDNAACTECVELYKLYRWHHEKIRETMENLKPSQRKELGKISAFHTDVRMYHERAVSPVESNDRNLGLVVRGTPTGERALRWFYNSAERNQDLLNGFYAHPNIGCIFFQNFSGENQIQRAQFHECLEDIASFVRAKQDANVVICGSLFGGTGAAGIPTVLNLVQSYCERQCDSEMMRHLHFGGVLLTPYFKVVDKDVRDDHIEVRSDSFMSNTRAALQYYQFTDEFDRVYLVGKEDQDIVNPRYMDGGANQKNKPHIVELFSAMATKMFLESSWDKDQVLNRVQVHIIPKGLQGEDRLGWYSDSFDPDFRMLANMIRAHTTMEASIYPYIEEHSGKASAFTGVFQWYQVFRMSQCTMDHRNSEPVIMRDYSEDFLDWIYHIQYRYGGSEGMERDDGIALCGIEMEKVEDCVLKRRNNGKNPITGSKKKPDLDRIQSKFNDTVDTVEKMGYLVKTGLGILSILGIVTPGLADKGALGLFEQLVKWASEKKAG